jgi:hypothetical protein
MHDARTGSATAARRTEDGYGALLVVLLRLLSRTTAVVLLNLVPVSDIFGVGRYTLRPTLFWLGESGGLNGSDECCGWFIDCLSKRTPLLNGLGFSGTSY